MAYYLVRFYSGSGDRPPEQLIRDVVDSELRPRLQQGGGLTRYITFVGDDGRVGSASVYENKAAAEKGLQIAREWAGATKAMQGYQLSQTLEGEIIRTFDGNLDAQPAYGAGRLWQTQTQGQELVQMIERSGVPALLQQVKGWRRTVLVQLQDGRIGTFSAFDSAQSRDQYGATVKKALSEQTEIRSAIQGSPEEISVRIVTSTGS
jgi:hypothetical protein